MAEISAKEVAKLRQKTGLSMMECKKALVECGGDLESAEDFLRKKMKGKMDTRTDRPAGEGLLAMAIAPDNSSAAIVEIRSETDFTAKNDDFKKVAQKVADLGLNAGSGDFTATPEMTSLIDEIRIASGENCSFARGLKLDGGGASFASYLHFDGKTGVLVKLNGSVSDEVRSDVCLHIVGNPTVPLGVTPDDIPESVVEKERKFRVEQAMESGKPQEIAEKMVEGGMRKFFGEVALLEQPFVKDPSKKIKDLIGDASISEFHRWAVGQEA